MAIFIEADFSSRPIDILAVDDVACSDMAPDQSLDGSGPNIFHHLSNQVYSTCNSGWICDV